MRADPEVFNVFAWARQGKLPNIKKMMDRGTYGYSKPVFPSHTPVNFATLLTGAYPKTHGVSDGPMHVEERPLDKVAIGGFSSTAKKVEPIWVTLEKAGKKIVLLSIPGSTPPELDEGIILRGRWAGWGADFYALNFQSKGDLTERKKQGRSSRLFFSGSELTRYIDLKPAEGWDKMPASFSPALEENLEAWGLTIFAYIFDTTDDGKANYDRVVFSLDKNTVMADLAEGEWGPWCPVVLKWQEQSVLSDARLKVIALKIDPASLNGFLRVRCLYNNLNRWIAKPPDVADDMRREVGPMVDFVDNFPPQLIYYPQDKDTFLEEMAMSFDWHLAATRFILARYQPDVYIHDTYSSNQMLTSRWWLGYIDPSSKRYKDVSDKERAKLWDEVLGMYKRIDDIAGEYLKRADSNTIIVLSSDHGVAPLNKSVNLNNLFAREGLLRFTIDKETGEPVIDWANSKVIYLKMDNIYIRPDGLAGLWKRGSGQEYEKLRNRVIKMLLNLQDENGEKPVAKVVTWEDSGSQLDLPSDRVGDLVVANVPGFGWDEEMTQDMAIFTIPLETGYKQAILPEKNKSLWTPFIIMGPGIKKNHELKKPIVAVDQYPTIMHLLGVKIPNFVEGKIVEEALEK